MTAKQALLAHLTERHNVNMAMPPSSGRRYVKPTERATLAELQRWHANAHHRYHLDHFHTPDGLGSPAGPNTADRRPSGWLTGLCVEDRRESHSRAP